MDVHPSMQLDIARQRHAERLVRSEQVRLARAVDAREYRVNPWSRLRNVLREHRAPAHKPSLHPAA